MDHQTSSYSVVIGSPTARSVYSITITNLSNIVNLFLCPCGLANAIKSQIRLFLRLPRPCLINYKYQHLTRVSSIANISPYYCKIGICRTIVEAMSGYNTHQEGPHPQLTGNTLLSQPKHSTVQATSNDKMLQSTFMSPFTNQK